MTVERKKRGLYARRKHRSGMPIPLLILVDVLMAGAVLLTFAFFHHVLPAMISERERLQTLENAAIPTASLSIVPEMDFITPTTETAHGGGTVFWNQSL